MGAEKSQALMSITVQAWKCQECCATSESLRAKAVCEKRGHSVVQVKVDRTRWECKNCSFSIFALDKHLPPHCHRCKSMVGTGTIAACAESANGEGAAPAARRGNTFFELASRCEGKHIQGSP